MRIIVESELLVSDKIDGVHRVTDPKCECGEYCFSFDKDGMQDKCRDYVKLLTGVKLCGWKGR